MDIPSIIVLIVVAVCLTGAVVYLVRNRGKGCGGCSGCSGGCAGCARQGKKGKKPREKPDDPPSACLKGEESVDNNGKDDGAEGGRTK